MHWLTHESGWLLKRGFVDCGGAAFVHFTGGVSAILASAFVGKRKNKNEKNDDTKVLDSHWHVYAVLWLFFCWFGFNGTGVFYQLANPMEAMGLIGMNNILSAALGALTLYLIDARKNDSTFTS